MLFLFKIIYIAFRHNCSDTLDLNQFCLFCLKHALRIISKCPADYLSIRTSDSRNSETINQSCKCCLSCLFNTALQFQERFFAKAIHCHDLISVIIKMEEICKVFHITVENEFLQCRLRKAFNIHRISAHKKCK